MTFRAENKESAKLPYTRSKFDIGSSTSHVGGNGHRIFLTCFSDNFRLTIVLLRVKHIVCNFARTKHPRKGFRDIHTCGTYKDRLSLFLQLFNLQCNRIVLFPTGFVDKIVHILTNNPAVCGNDNNIELIDFKEFGSLGFGRTGHTGKFFIEAEKVLDGDGRHGLRFTLNPDILLCFDSLMQTIAVATTGKNTSGKFIDNHHLTVLHDVLIITLEKGVCFQELTDIVQAFRALSKQAVYFVFFGDLFSSSNSCITLNSCDLRTDIRKHENIAVLMAELAEKLTTFIGQVNRSTLFVNCKIELVVDLLHPAGIVFKVFVLGALNQFGNTLLGEHLDVTGVFRLPAFYAKKPEASFCIVRLCFQNFFSFTEVCCYQLLLCPDQLFDPWFDFLKFAVVGMWDRS